MEGVRTDTTHIPDALTRAYRLAVAGKLPPNANRLQVKHPSMTSEQLQLVAGVLWHLAGRAVTGRFELWSGQLARLIGETHDQTAWYVTALRQRGVVRRIKEKVKSRRRDKRKPPVFIWFGIA